MSWAGHVVRIERNVYKVSVRNPEGRRPFGGPRRRLEENRS
jgi:hypothetical protein